MDNILPEESEIFGALQLLFAADGKNCKKMMASVRESDVKQAYRIRAMQTHPDRFASRGEDYQRLCSERFIQINNAYELLSTYLRVKEKELSSGWRNPGRDGFAAGYQPFHPGRNQAADRPGDRPRDFFTGSFWQNDVPRRHLRFGEFLYYSGIIPWKHWIRALVWQSGQRPRIGEIAQRWRWTTEMQIVHLILRRHPRERVGELMLHHRIINPFQLKVLLSHQRKLQRPIGEYFLHQSVLSGSEIQDLLLRQMDHNFRYGPTRF